MSRNIDRALTALAEIGDEWRADNAELSVLDFKETPDTARSGPTSTQDRKRFLKSIAETAACMANSDGGVIVVGVRDAASTREEALRGVDSSAYPTEDFTLAVHHGTTPHLTVESLEHMEDGARLVLVRVPRGAVVHATADGTYKRRVGSQCQPVGGAEMRDLQALRSQYDWSHEASGASIDSLNKVALEQAALRLDEANRSELAEQASNDPEQFLAGGELLAEDGTLRRAAALMYGGPDALRSVTPDYGLLITSSPSPGSEGSTLMSREDSLRRPIVLLVEDALARLNAVASREAIRIGAVQFELVDYPQDALRELVVNALTHRDWERRGLIEIHHSPDELVIESPGALLPTLVVERLLRETASRNRALAREVARLRIAEGAGLGFDRVWRTLLSTGKEPPQITTDSRFSVRVPGGRGDAVFLRFLRSERFPDPALAADLDVLQVLSTLRTQRYADATSMAPIVQRDVDATQAVLRRMDEAGLIEPSKRTARHRLPSYRLSQSTLSAMRRAVTYRTESIDEDDTKLISHLKRHRRITNEDVRNYLDCDVATARNRLTRFRKRGWIDFAPESPRRGPNVEYEALPALDQVSS